MHEALGLVPSSVNKPDVVTCSQNPNTRETENAGSEVQGHLWQVLSSRPPQDTQVAVSVKSNVAEYKEVSTIMKSVVVKYVSGVEEKLQSNKEKMGFRSLCVLQ